jgi:hypothetical protein
MDPAPFILPGFYSDPIKHRSLGFDVGLVEGVTNHALLRYLLNGRVFPIRGFSTIQRYYCLISRLFCSRLGLDIWSSNV